MSIIDLNYYLDDVYDQHFIFFLESVYLNISFQIIFYHQNDETFEYK